MSRDADEIRARLATGRAPTIQQVEGALRDGATIRDLTGETTWQARHRAADAIRDRRPELADEIVTLPAIQGDARRAWWRVVAADGTVLADRERFSWDPPDLADRLVAAHEAAAKEAADDPR